MDSAFFDVVEFEKAAGYELSSEPPSFPSAKVIELRRKLIKEEYGETMDALIKVLDFLSTGAEKDRTEVLAELGDGLADLIWVSIGTAIHFGIDLPEIWGRVKEANMAKFGPGSFVREDGKRMKPPGWIAPDIASVVSNQKPLSEIYG